MALTKRSRGLLRVLHAGLQPVGSPLVVRPVWHRWAQGLVTEEEYGSGIADERHPLPQPRGSPHAAQGSEPKAQTREQNRERRAAPAPEGFTPFRMFGIFESR